MKKILLGLLLLYPCLGYGFDLYQKDSFSLGLKGYYKNLFFTSKRRATNRLYQADLNRVRTEWEAHGLRFFSAKIIWDNELIGGNYLQTEEFAARQSQREEPYPDMNYDLIQKKNFFYGQSFYRAYLKFDDGPVVFTLGRQRIDWGVMHFFSPADLFTRLPLFDVEKDERVGTTAANLEIAVGGSLKINPVYTINPDFDQSRMGMRVTKTRGHFDFSLLGGRFRRDGIFGLDFAGDIHKAGIRGELIYDLADRGDRFIQGAAGIDYGFENTFYMALEYFFNGHGGVGTPGSGVLIQSNQRHFVSLNLKYDITPLWKVMMQNIVDLRGGSLFINPESQYSLFDWLEGVVGAHFPVGRNSGEFTPIPNVYYLQTQVYF